MVTTTNSNTLASPLSFSFAPDRREVAQPVQATLSGIEYPGEVIVADEWKPEFGEQLTGLPMFRVVLMRSNVGPSRKDLADDRICVAIQSKSGSSSHRIGETRTAYNVDTGSRDPGRSAEADIRSLREVQQRYAAVSDPELDHLASALVKYESQVNESLAAESHNLWRSGEVISASSEVGLEVTAEQIFLLDSPDAWIGVAAANLVDHSNLDLRGDESTVRDIFEELQQGRVKSALDHLRQMCGLRLNENTPSLLIHDLVMNNAGAVAGTDVVTLLVHKLGYPPAIASLWVVSYVLDHDAEMEFLRDSGEPIFISRDSISEIEFSVVAVNEVRHIRATKSTHWDAVSPYLQLIMPHAHSTRFGGGRVSDAEEFILQLTTISERLLASSPVMQGLEIAAGATVRPLTFDDKRLIEVLGAESWTEFVSRARTIFKSVATLRTALSKAALRWSAVEAAPDIERVIVYLDQVEFGRFDHGLAIEQRLLRSKIDLESLVNNWSSWPLIRDEFERWRQDYRRAYLEDHSQKRDWSIRLQHKIEFCSRRVEQIALFEKIAAIRLVQQDDIGELWDQTVRSFSLCENDGANIVLIHETVCLNCRGRLGQPANHRDVVEMITEIDRIFDEYRDRLAVVVSELVLESPQTDKLTSLFRLNSAGDLSDLANVLDDKVISFLNELFDDTSGNSGDWTSPHS